VEQAYLARKETNEKVALLRQRAQGLLLDDAAIMQAFQARLISDLLSAIILLGMHCQK